MLWKIYTWYGGDWTEKLPSPMKLLTDFKKGSTVNHWEFLQIISSRGHWKWVCSKECTGKYEVDLCSMANLETRDFSKNLISQVLQVSEAFQLTHFQNCFWCLSIWISNNACRFETSYCMPNTCNMIRSLVSRLSLLRANNSTYGSQRSYIGRAWRRGYMHTLRMSIIMWAVFSAVEG